jgi:hypothetical protein
MARRRYLQAFKKPARGAAAVPASCSISVENLRQNHKARGLAHRFSRRRTPIDADRHQQPTVIPTADSALRSE